MTIAVTALSAALLLPGLKIVVDKILLLMADSRSLLGGSSLIYGGTLLAQAVLFVPFFVCFGMCGFICYRYVLRRKRGQGE